LERADVPSKEDARICKTHIYSNQVKLAVEEHTMKPINELQLPYFQMLAKMTC
jgi:hypothetical protein